MAENTQISFLDDERMFMDWREGYTPTKGVLPGVSIEEIIEDQPMGRTLFDDLHDEDQLK